MELLRDLHRKRATICTVTHDPRFLRYAERSVHLFDGPDRGRKVLNRQRSVVSSLSILDQRGAE